MPNGDSMKSAIKQVASGRFGVTMEYLSNAQELQIKMAQGAKPGEGGELPGNKVEGNIANCRNSTEGVGLISPPPHHDIYSIEDLAQLIFDCKNANPDAGVSVKLVSEVGVGVVAAGVAKCKADHILISGCDGGTGASKWTGIKHAGAPWEIGLAETHQTLVLNGLRGRVTLETDGQLRTGRDVMIAALLGAERFGFATAPLIAMGCIMMRKCHLNTCPVGIATQDPVLRQKFEGLPEHVVNYLMLVAEEVRVLMAKLGFRSMDELIGHAEVLREESASRGGSLLLSPVLVPAHHLPDAGKIGKVENRKLYGQEHFMVLHKMIDRVLVHEFKMTFRYGESAFCEYKQLCNSDRSTGTLLSHELYKHWGTTLPAGTCHAKLIGTSGQSFGAFCLKGVFLELEGDSQDFFGKGLCGATLVVYPPRVCTRQGFKSEQNIIIGNTALYGATSGVALVNGVAGERFAVRNSGAWAVVEGAGDHCCEYMTGGRVCVLGSVGINFAAGMSGGVAWVWDPEGEFLLKTLPKEVERSCVDPANPHEVYPDDIDDLKTLLEAHVKYTESEVAAHILSDWPKLATSFVRVFPTDFKNAIVAASMKGNNILSKIQDSLPVPQEKKKAESRLRRVPSKPSTATRSAGFDIEDLGTLVKGQRPKKVEEVLKVVKGNRGFLELDRGDLPKRSVKDRTGDFQEILAKKDEVQVQTQAARCMDCGTPFCHQSVTERSGCPLGNLIPEWNDLVSRGLWHEAFKRLRKTNNFPEFTGRVCPAPCEGSCTLGIIDDPVSIKSIELTIIDKAYEEGWMTPQLPPFRTGRKVAIVGSGPCGLAAADQLNQMGHTVTVYERSDRAGGLMMYGVPNMKTDKVDVVQRRVKIMEKEGVVFKTGRAGNVGAHGDGLDAGPSARHILDGSDAVLLSVGATLARDLNVPGRQLNGVHLAMEYLHGNTKALLDAGKVGPGWRQWWGMGAAGKPVDAAGKKVVVIGGGDTGNDCIGTAVRQGATSVINLELLPQPPQSRAANNPWPHWPMTFKVDYGHEEAKLLNDGDDIRSYSVSTKEFLDDGAGNIKGMKIVGVKFVDGRLSEIEGTERTIMCDVVFLALGFLGPEKLLAEMFNVDEDQRGNYKALYTQSERDFATSNPKVFAAGDCRRGQSLVVWAIKEGRDAANAVNRLLTSEVPSSRVESLPA
jgi:glutamate synthase (NADPH/NADH)